MYIHKIIIRRQENDKHEIQNHHFMADSLYSKARYGYDVDGWSHQLKPRVEWIKQSLIMILVICASVFITATNAATDNASVSVSEISKNESINVAAEDPDTLIDYAAQQVNTLKREGIDLPDSASKMFDATERNAVQQAGQLQGDIALTGEYNESYYPLKVLNAGLPPLSKPPNISTPLATLEFFQSAVMKQQYDLAAYALNLNLIDADEQTSRSIELAKRLDFLLSKKQLYVFDDLPDRPDGLIEPPIGSSNSIEGIPRRSIQLGYMNYRERQVPIFIQRVRVGDSAPIWVFSAQTVDNIDNLYEQYKPAEFERYLPSLMTFRVFGIAVWEFVALLLFFSITMGLGWLLSKTTAILINWYVDEEEKSSQSEGKKSITDMVNQLTVPLAFTISFSLVFTLVSGGFPYIEAVATATRPIVWIGLVLSAVWLGIRAIHFFANRYKDLQIDGLGEEEYDKYRIRLTYVSIFRRVFIFVMILGSIWIGLSEFTNVAGLGKTLLTSAGIAGVVIGVAAQPTLGNIIAGMQVAITQPVRIGDTVMMQGDWTTIEDLRYTYAVLKTWDERRLIVPMRYFVTEIIENWSHTEVHQTCVVYLFVDYGINVDAVREKYIEVVKANELWDQETEPQLLVVSVDENTIKLRGALASNGPLNAWTLECEVRERMLAYLNEEQRDFLPTERLTFKGR